MGWLRGDEKGQADFVEVEAVDELLPLDDELEEVELDGALLEPALPESEEEPDGAAGLLLLDAARESVR